MNKFARRVAAGVAIGAVTLTGCSRPPSAAAVVEGQRVPDSAAREVGTMLAAVAGIDPSIAPIQATYDMTLGEASKIIADANGVTVTDGEIDTLVAGSATLMAAQATGAGEQWVQSVAYTNLVVTDLGEDAYLSDLKELDIEINPRYGTWDAENYTIVSSSLAIDTGA